MKKYLFLQLKRAFKLLPFLMSVTLILSALLGVIFGGIMKDSIEKKQTFNVAVTGDRDNDYLKIGLAAFKTLDEIRFSLNIIDLDEDEAEKALYRGEISAYVVLPEGFIEKALVGEIEPIKYVTSAGAQDVAALFKNEVTTLITDMVIASQKGVYGLNSALEKADDLSSADNQMTKLSIEYVNLVLKRSEMIEVKELGISDGLSLAQYYICGLFILIIMLMGLPLAPLCIKRDNSLSVFLNSKGYTNFIQSASEFIAYCAVIIMTEAIFLLCIYSVGNIPLLKSDILSFQNLFGIAVYSLPITVMTVSLSVMMFELSSNLVSGMLLHFFATVGLCYISGCFYPIYAFPDLLQKISRFLPTGVAFKELSSYYKGENTLLPVVGLFLFAVLFFIVSLIARSVKTINFKGSVRLEKAL